MPTFAFGNPEIKITDTSITVSAPCDARSIAFPKSRIITVERNESEILLFLTDATIVQLYDLPNSREVYDQIQASL